MKFTGPNNNITFDLDKMIAEESDPKMRVLLLLVSASNDLLAENTKAVEAWGNKLDKHLVNFEERAAREDDLRSQGKGAWRVLAMVSGIAYALVVALYVQLRTEINENRTAVQIGIAQDARHDARIGAIEAITRANKP